MSNLITINQCFKDIGSDYKWSFNQCVRSSQDPSGQIGQKFQSENGCLNTANRFPKGGSRLMLYPCESIHPVNGCFKFKEGVSWVVINMFVTNMSMVTYGTVNKRGSD